MGENTCSLFFEMKTETFENALVWMGPLVTVFVCIQAESKANEKRTKKITEKVQPASDRPIKPISINHATLESGNVVHILQVISFKYKSCSHQEGGYIQH